MGQVDVASLKKKAVELREDVLTMLNKAGSGHTGGSLSIVDILVALYYTSNLNVDPANFTKRERDKFILSKGHGCPALYAVLADIGFFPKEEFLSEIQNSCLSNNSCRVPDRWLIEKSLFVFADY